VGALANPEVGEYLDQHFVSSYQKVGSFRLVDGQKQGGNVASYFCTPNGGILDAIAGPVDAATLLREARWVVETRKMALLESHGNVPRYKQFFRLAHAEQLPAEPGLATVNWQRLPLYAPTEAALAGLLDNNPAAGQLDNQGKVHLLLALYPLVPLDQAYKVIYDRILNERVSTRPVSEGSRPADSGAHSWLNPVSPAQQSLSGLSQGATPYQLGGSKTAVELREEQRSLTLAHARDNPPATEVYAADPLNVLLADLQKLQEQGTPIPAVSLSGDVLAHINVASEAHAPTAGLLRAGGALRWPLVWHDSLLWEPSGALRESVEGLLRQAVAQAKNGPVDADLLVKLHDGAEQLDRLLSDNVKQLTPSTFIGARRYLQELEASLKVLERDDVSRYVDGSLALDSRRLKTVADVVGFMRTMNLKFTPAVGGDESAYLALHRALVSCDTGVPARAGANAGDL
jgi:hypothetical protein